MNGVEDAYRANRARVGSRCSYVMTHHTVDTSPVGPTSMFAALPDPLAQKLGGGCPFLEAVASSMKCGNLH